MTNRAALLDVLLADPAKAARVPRDEAVALLLELARVQRALELLPGSSPAPEPDKEGVWMTVDEVVALTGLSRRTVYARSKSAPRAGQSDWRPFAERAGRKTLRFRPGLRRILLAPKCPLHRLDLIVS
jgi:hypothetical protein